MKPNMLQYKINIEYALLQGFYWALYSILLSFSSVYLLHKGYTNSQIGVILAVGFLASVLLQQYIAAWADRTRRLTLPVITVVCVLCLTLCCIGLLFCQSSSVYLTLIFITACILEMLIQPLVNSLNFYLQRIPIKMNFGVARSIGSLFYSGTCLLLGIMIERKNPDILPTYGIFVCICVILLLFMMNYDSCKNTQYSPKDASPVDESVGIREFFIQYRMFFVFLIGGLGLYFGHTLINNYFYQIIINIHGSSQDLGNIQAFSALLELPAMIFFSMLHSKFGCRKLLQASAFFFVIKITLTLFATNIPMLYASTLFQSLSFAIFIPASVHLVNEVMLPKDAVKGQAFVTGMITIANLLSSLLGGMLLDHSNVFFMLLVGTITTVLGAGIAIVSLRQSNTIRKNSK